MWNTQTFWKVIQSSLQFKCTNGQASGCYIVGLDSTATLRRTSVLNDLHSNRVPWRNLGPFTIKQLHYSVNIKYCPANNHPWNHNFNKNSVLFSHVFQILIYTNAHFYIFEAVKRKLQCGFLYRKWQSKHVQHLCFGILCYFNIKWIHHFFDDLISHIRWIPYFWIFRLFFNLIIADNLKLPLDSITQLLPQVCSLSMRYGNRCHSFFSWLG